jgi:aspartate racemase
LYDLSWGFGDKGAEGIVLGCTEFPLMIFDEDLDIPAFNTTDIHAMAGVNYILNK